MAKKSDMVRVEKMQAKALRAQQEGRKLPMLTRVYNRCHICGRNRGYIRKFLMCRICFRERARAGELVGVRKSSW